MFTTLTYDWHKRTYTVTSDAGVWRHLSPGQVPHVLDVDDCRELMRVAREAAARRAATSASAVQVPD